MGDSTGKAGFADEIRAADLALNQAVAEADVEAFRALIAQDTAFFGSSGVLTSRDAVAEAWSVFFDESSGVSLTWAPVTAEAAVSGDLGFTTGRYTYRARGHDGETVCKTGDYVTIWRRGADGRWRAILDMGNPREQ